MKKSSFYTFFHHLTCLLEYFYNVEIIVRHSRNIPVNMSDDKRMYREMIFPSRYKYRIIRHHY